MKNRRQIIKILKSFCAVAILMSCTTAMANKATRCNFPTKKTKLYTEKNEVFTYSKPYDPEYPNSEACDGVGSKLNGVITQKACREKAQTNGYDCYQVINEKVRGAFRFRLTGSTYRSMSFCWACQK